MIHPTRKDTPKKFLDASLIPVKSALLNRAAEYSERAEEWNEPETTLVLNMISVAFKELAEELHHW